MKTRLCKFDSKKYCTNDCSRELCNLPGKYFKKGETPKMVKHRMKRFNKD